MYSMSTSGGGVNTGILDPHPLHADPDPWFKIFLDPDPGLDLINKLLFFYVKN